MRSTQRLAILGIAALVACTDAPSTAPAVTASPDLLEEEDGIGVFRRYVAMGTSISMGWQSDGAVATDQATAWPRQLAAAAGRNMTYPAIASSGCRSPLVAPLATGVRASGEAAGAPAASFQCAPLVPGTELPARNVAISAATTRDALVTTPALQADPFYSKLYPRILPPGETQLTATLRQKPRLVSIEFGGNEVLNARSGIAIPGVTIVPFATWAPQFTQLVDAIAARVKRAVVVGLINDVGSFPSFRRGDELWADRATFLAAFHVTVDASCDASPNLVFVPVRVPTAVATGLALRQRGLPPFVLTCTDGGLGVQDFVLSPAEQGVVNATLSAMSAHTRQTAARAGFAYFDLDALYGRSDLKPPFSVVQLMTSATPYGAYISLDGIHPNAAGHLVLAQSAAQALNTTYGLAIPTPTSFTVAP